MAKVNERFLSEQPVSITQSQTYSSAPTRFIIHITGKQSILIHCSIKISHIRQCDLTENGCENACFTSQLSNIALLPHKLYSKKEAESHNIDQICKYKYALCGVCSKFHIITSLELF